MNSRHIWWTIFAAIGSGTCLEPCLVSTSKDCFGKQIASIQRKRKKTITYTSICILHEHIISSVPRSVSFPMNDEWRIRSQCRILREFLLNSPHNLSFLLISSPSLTELCGNQGSILFSKIGTERNENWKKTQKEKFRWNVIYRIMSVSQYAYIPKVPCPKQEKIPSCQTA